MEQHLQIFTRWRCTTHDCGSYNFNQLVRHEVSSCDIIRENTVGVIKPKSFGGYNGDLGRAYIKEYQDGLREKQIQDNVLKDWLKYREKSYRETYRHKYPRTYDKKFKRVFRNSRKKN